MLRKDSLLLSKKASSKKPIIGSIIAGVIVVIILFFVFLDSTAVLGFMISLGVFAVILIGIYFWLKKVEDLPDVLT